MNTPPPLADGPKEHKVQLKGSVIMSIVDGPGKYKIEDDQEHYVFIAENGEKISFLKEHSQSVFGKRPHWQPGDTIVFEPIQERISVTREFREKNSLRVGDILRVEKMPQNFKGIGAGIHKNLVIRNVTQGVITQMDDIPVTGGAFSRHIREGDQLIIT